MKQFRDRHHAGKLLAEKLTSAHHEIDTVVALPRGGVPVGYEIARKFHTTLNVLPVRKLGAPHNPELGFGAITRDRTTLIDPQIYKHISVTKQEFDRIKKQEANELETRYALYKPFVPKLTIHGRTIVLTDDGVATGITLKAALVYCSSHQAGKIIIALPVIAQQTLDEILPHIRKQDEFVTLKQPDDLQAVSTYYRSFEQVTHEAVIRLLMYANRKIIFPSED